MYLYLYSYLYLYLHQSFNTSDESAVKCNVFVFVAELDIEDSQRVCEPHFPFFTADESPQISHQLVVTSDTLDLVNHQPATHFDRPTVLSGGNIGAH